MSSYFDRLGLTPQERRLVVFVAAVVFVVVNLWLVWPRFKDWGIVTSEMKAAAGKIQTYQAEISRQAEYERKLKALEGAGASVQSDEAFNLLQNKIQTQASLSQLTTTGINPVGTGAAKDSPINEFFEERAMRVGFIAGDAELVDFLVSIGSGDSMIRARDIDLKPDASQTKLQGNITLVASFQKRRETKVAPAKPASVPTAAKPTTAKPAATITTPGSKVAVSTNKPSRPAK
jgi:hypothetical protein